MISGFDHFIVLVNNLEQASEAYRQLGFEVQPGGEHPRFGSHNALVPFADATYLELLAFREPDLASTTFWGDGVRKLKAGEGFGGFVLTSDNLTQDAAQIRARKLDIADPQPGSRVRPDGAQLAWRTALVNGNPVGILPFLIQDETPRGFRIPPAGSGLGIQCKAKEVVVAVKNAEVARQAYRELLDIEPRYVQNTTGDLLGFRVSTSWGSIILAHPERKGNAMADQLAARGEGLYALTLAVEDVNRARADIVKRQIKIEDDPAGFLILPQFACGARIRLVQA